MYKLILILMIMMKAYHITWSTISNMVVILITKQQTI